MRLHHGDGGYPQARVRRSASPRRPRRPQRPRLRRGGGYHTGERRRSAASCPRGAAAPACPELRDLPRPRLPRLPMRRAGGPWETCIVDVLVCPLSVTFPVTNDPSAHAPPNHIGGTFTFV